MRLDAAMHIFLISCPVESISYDAGRGCGPRSTPRTTFQRELDAARVRVAMRILVERDAPLTEIAYDVGCASPQHFSTLFRRVIGTSPSAWRGRQR
jgi:hypothetical protein